MTLSYVWDKKKGHRPRLQIGMMSGTSWNEVDETICKVCKCKVAYKLMDDPSGTVYRRYRLPKRFNCFLFQWQMDLALHRISDWYWSAKTPKIYSSGFLFLRSVPFSHFWAVKWLSLLFTQTMTSDYFVSFLLKH